MSASGVATRQATRIGCGAIALWSLLALFTAVTGPVPPLQLLALTFAIATIVGALPWLWRPQRARALRQPLRVWALGVGGLFGYHALYFAALKLAPAAEANLVNYLWPLLIVLFSALLPGERLRPAHVLGALCGLAGVAVLAVGGGVLGIRAESLPGYASALGCAFVWAGYSVLSRRVSEVPTDAVSGFCFATAILGLLGHLAFETTVMPANAAQWLAIGAAGIGPVGVAFFLWDIGMKRGDVRLLGVLSYATPVLSTLILVSAGYAEPSVPLALACGLIVAGALVATWPWRQPRAA